MKSYPQKGYFFRKGLKIRTPKMMQLDHHRQTRPPPTILEREETLPCFYYTHDFGDILHFKGRRISPVESCI